MAVVRNAEDALPAFVECTQRDGPSVLLSHVGAQSRYQQYPPLHNTTAVILVDVSLHSYAHQCSTADQCFQKQLDMLTRHCRVFHCLQYMYRRWTGSQRCQTRWAHAAELHAQEMLPVTPSHSQSCCFRELPVPKRSGLQKESSDFICTRFLVSFYQFSSSWHLKTKDYKTKLAHFGSLAVWTPLAP